jgi:DNA repair exonuclease SbcCD nuclease subunit
MKSLIIGDLHIGNNKNNPVFHKIVIDFAKWIKQQAEERGITHIIQCGDVFHDRVSVNLTSIECAYQFFNILKEFDMDIITGNHDCFYLENSTVHSLFLFKQWPNVTVHDSGSIKDDVFYAPWGTTLEEFQPAKILIGHLELNGYEMSKNKICTKGINAADIVEKYSLVLSGHFHKPQGRKYGNKILLYTGSGYQLNWGEAEEDKYLYVLDHDTLKMEKIKNTVSPRFEYIKSEEDYSKIKNNFVSISVHGGEDREKMLSLLSSFDPIRIDTKLVDKISEAQKDLSTYKTAINIDELIKEYINDIFKDFSDEEKNALITLYTNLYKELES